MWDQKSWFHGLDHKKRRIHGFANKELANPCDGVVQHKLDQ
jgi:hypothetical protein